MAADEGKEIDNKTLTKDEEGKKEEEESKTAEESAELKETLARSEAKKSNQEFMETCGSRDSFFHIENWHPLIKDYTFPMSTVTLTHAEARAMTRYKEISKMLLMCQDADNSGGDPHASLGHWDSRRIKDVDKLMQENMEPESLELMRSLVSKLDGLIEGYGRSAFVKLSTRSPKDAVLMGEPVKAHLRRLLADSPHAPGSPEAEEEDMIAFTRAICWAMRVSSGHEAVTLLVRSSRAFQDLIFAELVAEDKEHFPLQLIVRPWEEFLPEWEFRAFVFGGVLTTCSQYYPDCFVTAISQQQQAIKERIHQFWDTEIRAKVPQANYTVDFVLSPDLHSIRIIELNNPPPVAGVALFNWEDPADRELIFRSPEFQLRVLHAVPDNPKSRIHPPLRQFILHLRGRHDDTVSPHDIRCDHCGQNPLSGRWHFCRVCGDYDLCESCYAKAQDTPDFHPHSAWCQAENPAWIAAHPPAEASRCLLQ